MYSSILVQLSWLLLLFSSLVQCQFFGPNAIAAQLELLRAQGRPIPFFQQGLLSTAQPEPTTARQSVEEAEETTRRVTRASTTATEEAVAAPTTLQVATSSRFSSILGIGSPEQTLRAAIPSPETTAAIVTSQAAPLFAPVAPTTAAIVPQETVAIESDAASIVPTAVTSSTEAADTAPQVTGDAAEEGPQPMGAGAMAGIGIGITFSVLSVAGLSGFYLWRRHQAKHNGGDNDQEQSSGRFAGLGGFFNRNKDHKDDPEWSIGSAEKVAIVGNGLRAQSIDTVSRSDSTRSNEPMVSGGNGGTPPKRKLNLPNTALGSHPLSPAPDISSFPKPPSSAAGSRRSRSAQSDRKDETKEEKATNWPLSA